MMKLLYVILALSVAALLEACATAAPPVELRVDPTYTAPLPTATWPGPTSALPTPGESPAPSGWQVIGGAAILLSLSAVLYLVFWLAFGALRLLREKWPDGGAP